MGPPSYSACAGVHPSGIGRPPAAIRTMHTGERRTKIIWCVVNSRLIGKCSTAVNRRLKCLLQSDSPIDQDTIHAHNLELVGTCNSKSASGRSPADSGACPRFLGI